MWKIKIPEGEIRKLNNEIKDKLRAAFRLAVKRGFDKGRAIAASTYSSSKPFEFWNRGYKLESRPNDIFIIKLDGELSEIFEEGKTSKLPKYIMKGHKAEYNAKTGKPYVDVPMVATDVDGMIKMGKQTFEVSRFNSKNADDIVRTTTKATKVSKSPLGNIVVKSRDEYNVLRFKPKAKDADAAFAGLIKNLDKNAPGDYVMFRRINADTQWKDTSTAPRVFSARNEKLIVDLIQKTFNDLIRGGI